MGNRTDKGIIAKKIGMTRIVDDKGVMVPVTLLEVQDQKVTKILTEERDGYNGFQVGYFTKAEKNLTKPDVTRLRKSSIQDNYARFKEFRTATPVEGLEVGAAFTAELFAEVAAVDVSGSTKGRGFQGSVKRWGSRIGRMTHGSRFHRRPGSLGQCTTPGRVYKNKKMPGQYGDIRKTVKNLQVLKVDTDMNVIAVKGSTPGNKNGFIEIRPTNSK